MYCWYKKLLNTHLVIFQSTKTWHILEVSLSTDQSNDICFGTRRKGVFFAVNKLLSSYGDLTYCNAQSDAALPDIL